MSCPLESHSVARCVMKVAPMLRPLLASLVLFGSVSVARAQEPKPMLPGVQPTFGTEPTTPRPLHASITFSPLHLIFPVGEIAAEIAVSPKFGVAVIGGIGSVKPENSDTRVLVYEVGISPRFYLWGDFRKGVQLGAEAVYVHASADDQFMSTVSAEGLGVGPYVGYKWVSRIGLTLEAQLGASYLALRGDGVSQDDSRFSALLNLQVGWSF